MAKTATARKEPTQMSPTTTGMALPLPRAGGGRLLRLGGIGLRIRRGVLTGGRFEAHATATALAGGALANQLDSRLIHSADQFHERVHIAPNDPLASLHPLDRRDCYCLLYTSPSPR